MQIDKLKKTASINFFDDIANNDFHIKLFIENIIIFRDTLISKMNSLDIRVVSKMIDPKQQLKRRITLKDMTKMKLEEIEREIKELKKIIEKGEVDSYTVNTFTTLCGKAIEELSKNNDDMRQLEIMNMMKSVLQMEPVRKLTEMERNKDKIGEINMRNKNIINNEIKEEPNKEEEDKKEDDKKEEPKKEEDKKEEEIKIEIKQEEDKKEPEPEKNVIIEKMEVQNSENINNDNPNPTVLRGKNKNKIIKTGEKMGDNIEELKQENEKVTQQNQEMLDDKKKVCCNIF